MSHHIGGRGHWNKSLFSEDRARTDVHFVIDGFDDVSDATEMNGFQVLHMFPICTFGQFVHLKHAKKNCYCGFPSRLKSIRLRPRLAAVSDNFALIGYLKSVKVIKYCR